MMKKYIVSFLFCVMMLNAEKSTMTLHNNNKITKFFNTAYQKVKNTCTSFKDHMISSKDFVYASPTFNHLIRPSSEVTFYEDSSNPILSKYEKNVYKSLNVPYRRYSKDFYSMYSGDEHKAIIKKFENIQNNNKSDRVKTALILDGTKTRKIAKNICKDTTEYLVTIQKNGIYNGHSTMVVTDLPKNQKPTAFVIDSLGGDPSINYLNKGVSKNHKLFNLVNASEEIGLQRVYNNDDYNCALYSINHADAAVKFLNKPSYRLKHFDNALHHEYTNESLDRAGKILHHGMKKYLPMYYTKNWDGSYTAKPQAKIKQYHLQQRWEMGNEYLHAKKRKWFENLLHKQWN